MCSWSSATPSILQCLHSDAPASDQLSHSMLCVTKPNSYSNSTHFSDHFAHHIAFLCYHVTVRLMLGSSDSHHAPVHMTKSSLMWLSASSCDCQSHFLITFCLTCNTLLPSPLLLSSTFNLYSHSTTLSHLLFSLSSSTFCHSLYIVIHFLTKYSHSTMFSLIRLPLPPFSLYLSLSLDPYTLIMLTTYITHLYD